MANKPKEAKNTLRSKAVARVIDLIGNGQIEVIGGDAGIYLEKTQLEGRKRNFEGVRTYFRTGTAAQSYIPGFRSVENEVNIGVQLSVAGGDIIRTITDTSADAFLAKIRVNGLSKTFPKNGNMNPTTVSVSVWRKNSGGSYNKVYTFKIKGKTNSPYEAAKRIELPAGTGPWDIKFTRDTADSNSSYLRNDTYVTSYTLIYDRKLAYPYSALVGLEVDAKKFGSAFPERRYKARRVDAPYPSNWNPTTRVYTGIWDGTFLTGTHDNPAWYLWELMTNDLFGLGDIISSTGINKWNLYTIAQYCDGLINGKPRFTFNVQVMNRRKAIELLDAISAVFRGMIYWSAGAVDFAQDAPGSPVIDVTEANIIGGFHRIGSARKARHTSAIVAWNNPTLLGEVDYVTVPRDDLRALFGDRPKEVAAFGCTDEDEARRVGEWLLDTEAHETEVITWRCSFDHLAVFPGRKVRVFDPASQGGRFAGRAAALIDNYEVGAKDLSNAAWTKLNATITVNAANDQDGNLLADKFAETAATGWHSVVQAHTAANGERISRLVIAKAVERTKIRIGLTDNSAYAVTANFDLSAGTVSAVAAGNTGWSSPAASITAMSGGYYACRFSATKQNAGADPDAYSETYLLDASGNVSYTGVAGNGVYIAHSQWEKTSDVNIPVEFSALKVDDPAGVSLASATLNTMTPAGALQSNTVQKYTDSGMYVHTTARFGSVPQVNSLWSITSSTITGELATVTGIFEKAPNVWEVQSIKHDPTKYARIERGLTITHPAYTTLPSGQLAAPTDLNIVEYFIDNNGTFEPALTVSWLAANDARVTAYEYQYAEADGDFNDPVRADTLALDLDGVDEGIFAFRLRSVANPGVFAAPSDWLYMEVNVVGANTKPQDVTGLRCNSDGSISVLKWVISQDAITTAYEIRFSPLTTGATWDGSTVVGQNIGRKTDSWSTVSRVGTFLIKGVSKAGKYSNNAATVVNRVGVVQTTYTGQVDESANWYGLLTKSIIISDFVTGDWVTTNATTSLVGTFRETVATGQHKVTYSTKANGGELCNFIMEVAGNGGRNVKVRISDQVGNFVQGSWDTTAKTLLSSSSSGMTNVTFGASAAGAEVRATIQFNFADLSDNVTIEIYSLSGTSDTFAGNTSNGFTIDTANWSCKTTNQTMVNNAGNLELQMSGSNYVTSGHYEFANTSVYYNFDPSVSLPKKSGLKLKAQFEYTVTDDGAVLGDVAAIGDWSSLGGNADGITITPQVRSADTGVTSPSQYSDWQDLTDALFIGKAFQFRFIVTSTNPLITPVISSAVINWEVPVYIESETGIGSGAGWYTVTFDQEFIALPSIQITPYSQAEIEFQNRTTTGFNVRFKNVTSGVVVGRLFDWTATGFGPVVA